MNVAEQLATLYRRLAGAGWQRLNGNTWRSGTYTLRTAYVWGEATLEIVNTKGKRLGSRQRWYYRGANPLTWLGTEALNSVRKDVAKVLDTEAEAL